MRRHVVLVGLSGSGKTAAGRVVAATLGCPFCDLDDRISVAMGMPIAEVFASQGEAAFREAERLTMARTLAEPPQVIAAGGGWAAQAGNLDAAAHRAVIVWLRCSPATAAARLAGSQDRPLLRGDLRAGLDRLATERRAFYERADATVETDGRSVGEVADAVVLLARSVGGW